MNSEKVKDLYRGKTYPKEEGTALNNVWVEGDLVVSRDKYYIHPRSNCFTVENDLAKLVVMHEVIPESVGIYTGFEEKGTKIFTGDIVKVISHGYIPDTYNGEVVLHKGSYCIKYEFGFSSEDMEIIYHRIGKVDTWRDMGASGTITYTYEVIGNIHDNPELLEVK